MRARAIHRVTPGPDRTALVASMWQLAGQRLRFFSNLRDRFGPTVAFSILGTEFVMLSGAEDIEHVLGANAGNYRKGVGQKESRAVMSAGLLTSEGADWQDGHARLAPLFHRASVERAAGEIHRITSEMVREWRTRRRIDLVRELAVLSLRATGITFLGLDLSERARALAHDFATFERRTMASVLCGLFTPRAIGRPVPRLLVAPWRPRLLAHLKHLDLRGTYVADHYSEASDDVLADHILTLLWTGHDTTAAATASALAEIMSRAELHAAIREKGRTGDSQLLMQTIHETLRLHPPVWMIPRVANEQDRLPSCTISPGTNVMICTYLLHRDSSLWPTPNVFDPSRFSREGHHRMAFLPFGAGPRRCVGAGIALKEMEMVISGILRNTHMTLLEKDVRYSTQLTLRPKQLLCDAR